MNRRKPRRIVVVDISSPLATFEAIASAKGGRVAALNFLRDVVLAGELDCEVLPVGSDGAA
ncbi:MAG: hypothetical protein AB7R77_05935 [Ilumatobacteraceae bacterium]